MKSNFKSNKKEVLATLEEKYVAGLNAVGMFVGAEAQLRAAVDTGNLRDSIVYEVEPSEKAVVIGTNVEYAEWVEKGTSRMGAQPFLTPAIEQNTGRAKDLFYQTAKL